MSDEPRIIEETVTKGPGKASSTSSVGAPTPLTVVPRTPDADSHPDVPTHTSPPLPSDVLTPPASTQEEPPVSAPAEQMSVTLPTRSERAHIQDDIQEILKGVKLPERRNKASVPSPTPVSPVAPSLVTEHPPVPTTTPEAPATETAHAMRDDTVTSVHTLKDDLQTVARVQKISVIKAAALEEEKRHRPLPEGVSEKAPRRIPFAFIIAGGLVTLGCAALIGVFLALPHSTSAPQQPGSLIFAEQTVAFPIIPGQTSDTRRALADARRQNITLGAIQRVIPLMPPTTDTQTQGEPATAREFFASIGAHPPQEFIDALGDNFFFGIHAADKNAPLLILPIISYEHAFAGMLAWEGDVNGDLAPIYTAVPAVGTNPDGTPGLRRFSDEVIRNYDVRALKDDTGQIVLYYSFPSRSILIIAESPYTFSEALTRLRAARQI